MYFDLLCIKMGYGLFEEKGIPVKAYKKIMIFENVHISPEDTH